jgi:hypothetical protein
VTPPAPAQTPARLMADRVMKARHGGRCHLCPVPVRVGDHIGRVRGRWSHLACVVAAQRAARSPQPGRPVV